MERNKPGRDFKKLYCISGLGANFLAFRNIKLPEVELIPVEWLPVEHKESFSHYCDRLIDKYISENNEINLLGLSFGGTVAQTIAEKIPVEKTVLLSTIRSTQEFPFYYHLCKKMYIDKVVPKNIFNFYNPLIRKAFGIKNKRESEILKKAIQQTDAHFSKWAVQQILRWKPTIELRDCLRIHGTADRIIPYPENDTSTKKIEGGTHLMVLNRAREINQLISNYLWNDKEKI